MYVEIEVAGNQNESLHFRPLGRSVRGRFDLNAETEPLARMKFPEWPQIIPGQRIGVNSEACEGCICEPLQEPEQAANRERVHSRGMQLPISREVFQDIDVPTWIYWMRRAVVSGIARIVQGEFPEKLSGVPQKSFITKQAEPANQSREDRLLTAIENQNKLIASLVTRLGKESK